MDREFVEAEEREARDKAEAIFCDIEKSSNADGAVDAPTYRSTAFACKARPGH
jgi:hypothetical protein